MTGPPTSYDDYIGRPLAPTFPTAAQFGTLLVDLRAHRLELQAQADAIMTARDAEPDFEISNQMEEPIQNLTGALGKVNKAIPLLEAAQRNIGVYASVTARMEGIVDGIRTART